jgi:hypothetical protein
MSKIEVNTVDVQCGSTLTLGSSGKTVTLATGASQSGFGRTGTVDWCTTAKTSPFTAVSGDGFFVNTSGGVVTVTLPASPSAGDIVAFKDYGNTWACNAVTICRNSSKINGICSNTNLNTKSQSVTLIYVDGTKGWQDIQDSTSNVSGNPGFIEATGGTIAIVDTNFKTHTFTGTGTFAVTNIGTPTVGKQISYMVIAGGGGGASEKTSTASRSGGGAGGFREAKQACAGYTASPLAVAGGQTVAVQSYPVTIGAGGAGGPGPSGPADGSTGVDSVFNGITSAGGGNGSGTTASAPGKGGDGGSGGGGTQDNAGGPANGAGLGNTPPVSPPQGNNGGISDNTGPTYLAGGGGGAGGVGGSAPAGNGGNGIATSITGSPVTRAGGGGGGASTVGTTRSAGAAGPGGGGQGNTGCGSLPASIGTANTGGGGGGGAGGPNPFPSCGGAGGSGVVVIRYKFQ